jgi:2-amino-4-hydroxy-6-hydroxymethyldihydropteridine diphosphokinase
MLYGIAFGSNLGNRFENLRLGARALLEQSHSRLVSASNVYETEPVDCPEGSSLYLNAVITLDAIQTPHELHRIMQSVEAQFGRPSVRALNAPRELDLDILFADGLTMKDEQLTIPHPRLHLRRFVLQPLADICPEMVLPGQRQSVTSLLARLEDDLQKVTVISDHHWATSD